jgi:endonuclease/exonuclease/phosphatase family metal-dependent hydrolase
MPVSSALRTWRAGETDRGPRSSPGPVGQDVRVTLLRVLCYNVRGLRDDQPALARVIRAAQPHVVVVQEAARLLRWRSKNAALARRAGLVGVTGGRPSAGNVILCSLAVEVRATRDTTLSAQPHLHRRGVALAMLELAGHRFAVAGTHLDLVESPRLRHLDEIADLISGWVPPEVPLLLAADLNAQPGSATFRRVREFGTDAFDAVGDGDGCTYSSVRPVRRIDGMFADPRLTPSRAEVIDSADVRRASDHRPVLVEFEL